MLNLPLIHWLVILSAFINIGGAYAYISDTLSGKSKPNRISWFMWALTPLIGSAAAFSSGADFWATLNVLVTGLLSLSVFLASFVNPRSYWQMSRFDLICGVLSSIALFAWRSLDSPRLAIIFALIGDAFALFPTLIKAWKYPESETGVTYVTSLVSIILILPSIPVWNIENAAFQTYFLLANGILIFSIYRQRWKFKPKIKR